MKPRFAAMVSIPHRYAKNPAIREKLIGSTEFQFLIGTLKTVKACARAKVF